ncbi:hypothetical protein EW146_g9471 [Bondarzewia mesenterica]|uniref:AB hydrolase-1 domain-containing protein n=1 Tax=Bondarzewia mesenterica TaxID=1095465 RepID=A0A4S4L5Y6_9AGAM|nr:hypothetical protein EW146_g9471 [Bondarzewia mesenterica]
MHAFSSQHRSKQTSQHEDDAVEVVEVVDIRTSTQRSRGVWLYRQYYSKSGRETDLFVHSDPAAKDERLRRVRKLKKSHSMSNFLPSLETFAKGTAATAAGLSTIGMLSRVHVPTPTDFSLPYTDLELTTPDGVRLKSYLLLQRPNLHVPGATQIEWDDEQDDEAYDMFSATRPTIIMFHGNGGNHGHRIPLAKIFFAKMRCNVLMLSYRGYGHSEGSPSEKGLQIDAQTGLDYVLQHDTLSRTPISIGGAVAIDLCSRNTQAITALILENTFMSLPRLIPSAFPILSPFSFLCHQKWESYLKVPKVPKSIRILMLGGAQDEVVPRTQMQGLWQLVRSRTNTPSPPSPSQISATDRELAEGFLKMPAATASEFESGTGLPTIFIDGGDKYLEFPAGGHNDTCIQAGYWTAVAEFIASLHPLAELARKAADQEKTRAIAS